MKVKNKNRSSIKTRQKIREAFAELLKEKNELSNMTVTELVKLADITRSTFYTHYDSIYDVAKDLQDETLELISIYDKDIRSINDLDKYIDRVIKNLKDNEDMYLAMQTITVPAGQRVNLDLPDGSNVWLNAGTKMQYPVSFMTGKREVILDGEAYFEVVHNEKSPFVVHTSTLDVEVLGTKFNVEAYSARKIFETSLMEGKVKVKLPHDDKNSVVLVPNQKTTLIDGRLVVSKIDDYNVYRWKEGLYCFRNKPFADIIKDLEKYYDLSIQMDKKEIAKVALTGKFRISDGLDYALRVLQNDVAFTYQRNRDNDVIHIRVVLKINEFV